jgi:hypothetical protein
MFSILLEKPTDAPPTEGKPKGKADDAPPDDAAAPPDDAPPDDADAPPKDASSTDDAAAPIADPLNPEPTDSTPAYSVDSLEGKLKPLAIFKKGKRISGSLLTLEELFSYHLSATSTIPFTAPDQETLKVIQDDIIDKKEKVEIILTQIDIDANNQDVIDTILDKIDDHILALTDGLRKVVSKYKIKKPS